MRFRQLDRIIDIEPGRRIRAARTLRADERYLEDHFPNFAVMPGVLMLEGLFQASMWLALSTDEFRNPLVLLREMRAVKYSGLVLPGDELTLTAEVAKWEGRHVVFRCNGTVRHEEHVQNAVSARLHVSLERIAETNPARWITDCVLRRELQDRLRELMPESPLVP